MYIPTQQSSEEFHKHQKLLLPFTSRYIGSTNLDIGCGNGITSVIHRQRLGIRPTLCDIADIRAGLARSMSFRSIDNGRLPFASKAFVSSYLQYVLHHLESSTRVMRLLGEAFRVSERVIIVEEIRGSR